MTLGELADQLTDELLHILVFGPGFGESIMVRIPPGEWLIVDALRQHGARPPGVPAATVLHDRGEQAAAIALTHPHLDHTDGFATLLDYRAEGGAVGCLAAHLDLPSRWRGSPDGEEELKQSATEAALQRIFDIWESEPKARWDLVADASLDVGAGRVRVLHPPDERAQSVAKHRDRNRASAPMLIEWAAMGLLLGADLPNVEWKRLPQHFSSASTLALTAGLKASHHASGKAQHNLALGTEMTDPRAVLATPWTRGGDERKLPRFEAGNGVDRILRSAPALHMTALPMPGREPANKVLSLASARALESHERIGGELTIDFHAPPSNWDEAWVHVAWDASGSAIRQDLGDAAVSIISS